MRAEQEEESERRAFVRSTASDAFVAGQALAILEGSASLVTREPSLPAEVLQNKFVPQTGLKLGRYRIGTLLGEGATGSVYSAWDEDLNRPVAIKFFAALKPGRGGELERPLREARAASALNHPNIIMVHEVIEAPETAAIVMELVEGLTLRELSSSGRAPLDKVLHWYAQLANALAVAHRSQLIHGDLKPENAMVRDDGYVKLLDFGLAIGTGPGPRASQPLTGTLRYLSPEQYLGEPASQASDIFAFGVMLYELATGQYPFPASNAFELMQAIAGTDVVRARTVNPQLPPALDELIAAMMAKQPGARPTASHAADLLAGLAGEYRERARQRRRAWWTRPAWALGAAAAITSVLLVVRTPRRQPLDVSRMTTRPLASQVGLETDPSISPDGHSVALTYRPKLSDPPEVQIHSTQGNPLVTIDTAGLVPQGVPAWSPDGTQLVFAAFDVNRAPHLFVARRGASGWEPPRKLADCAIRQPGICGVDWSPGGQHLVVADLVTGTSQAELYLLDLAGQRVKTLVPPGPEDLSRPRFSPDGNTVAFSRQASLITDELCLVDTAGGPVHRATSTPWFLKGFAWSRLGSIVAISARQSDRAQLWEFPVSAGAEPHRLAGLDVGRGSSPSLARQAGTLTWTRDMSASSLWKVPLTGQRSEAPVRLSGSASRDTDADWSSDGRIVFRSDRSGSLELWVSRADGSRPRQATRFGGPMLGDPRWSPDGRSIAFTLLVDRHPDIFTVRCESPETSCEPPRPLTRTPATGESNPLWSRDGRWIYFASNQTGRFELWRMAADDSGAPPVQITWNGGYQGRESADGKWLYYCKVTGHHGFYRLPLPLPEPMKERVEEAVAVNVPWAALGTWALTESELLYYPALGGVAFPPVRAVHLKTRTNRDLPVGDSMLGRGLSTSADGRWLLQTREDRKLSLAMIAEEAH
ncbi:MAG: serine/threonine-protein kinase [Bryobacterales bacterium]|nr:serine/threonine-protein kinase [Bryobacterales bacterium]